MKVFLGGTVADSKWREYVIPKLEVDFFNPVVEEWTEEDYKKELYEREHCDFCLYVLSPKMEGWYSIAEVADDSYKKSDKTIFCYLPKDDDQKFTDEQISELQNLGKLIRANGAIWKQDLDEVIEFLNSANTLTSDNLLQQTDQINNAFISYGRRHSLAFARRLYQNLTNRGYSVWFDMNDIPLGVDFQEQIDDGIRKADNFIYVMSPHSINSVYCYKELVLALKYNKRIIPILHVEPQDNATWDKIDPEAGKRNWIYMRQDHDTALDLSARAFEVKEKILDTPDDEWKLTDDFENAFENLVSLMDSHRAYVRTHTVLLDKSLDWTNDSRTIQKLLVGKERIEAERFLERSHQVFKNHTGHLIQPPCSPTDLIAEYIMESKKNGNNMQSDLFICHDVDDSETVNKIMSSMAKRGYSSWISSRDITKGIDYNHAIHNGVVQSGNMLFFISEKSLKSEYCKKEYSFAVKYNKRIIPVLIELNPKDFKNPDGFDGLSQLQYIDFTDLTDEIKVEIKDHNDVKEDVEARREKTPFESSINVLVNSLNYERTYHEEHRVYMVQALNWKEQGQKQSFLLRGFNFENAKTWLRLNKNREQHGPLDIHEEFIMASEAAKGSLGADVFISYSRKDGDFARQLNRTLQSAGKTTWFDQESISKGVDFEKEIFKGINGCDNFVFIISPDSIDSEYCEREVEYAVSQNKRILTVLARKTDPESLPEALRLINWIDFIENDFSEVFADLVQAIELDHEHASIHTQIQQRANEWNEHGRSLDFALNATACNKIEKWLSEAYNKDIKTIYSKSASLKSVKTPAPTKLQIEYTKISRNRINEVITQERKRQRITITIISLGAAISIAFGIFGFYEKGKAKSSAREVMLKDAKSLINDEEYEKAKEKYNYILKKLETSDDSAKKGIIICEKLSKNIDEFKGLVQNAESLLKTDSIENFKLADKLFKKAEGLKYFPGDDIIKNYKKNKKTIVNKYIDRAKKYLEIPNKELHPRAKEILWGLEEIDPGNLNVKELLKKFYNEKN